MNIYLGKIKQNVRGILMDGYEKRRGKTRGINELTLKALMYEKSEGGVLKK